MKKIITILLTAILFTSLVLPLASCSESSRLNRMDEAERAVAFYEMVEENGNKATSLSVKQSLYLKLDIGDVAYEQLNEGVSTYEDKDGEISMLEQTTTTVWVGGEKTVTYTDEGYMNGMMFTYNKEGKAVSKLKSPITWEEYEAFRDNQMEDVPEIGVGEGFCTTMTCKQGDDGIWTATYEGFTELGMKYFRYIVKGLETAIEAEHTLKDVRLTYVADKDLTPLSQKMEFIFDEKEGAETRVPVITAEMEITGLNNTVFSEEYDISDFTEVEDLRIIRRFADALEDRMTADCGTYTYTHHQTTVSDGEITGRDYVTDIRFDTIKGRFSLDMTSEGTEWNNEAFFSQYVYYDGIWRAKEKDRQTGEILVNEESPMTDSEARSVLVSRLIISEYYAFDIISTEVLDETAGKYRLYFGEQMRSRYAETYENSGGKLTVFESYVDVILDGNVLNEYTYYLHTGGRTGKSMEQDNQVKAVCSFVDK